jgi:hypothetical protein
MRNYCLFILLALWVVTNGCKKEDKIQDSRSPVFVDIDIIPAKIVYPNNSVIKGSVLQISWSQIVNKEIRVHVKLGRNAGQSDVDSTIVIPAGYKELGWDRFQSVHPITFNVLLGEGYVNGPAKEEYVECDDKTLNFGDPRTGENKVDFKTSVYFWAGLPFGTTQVSSMSQFATMMNFDQKSNCYTFKCGVVMWVISSPSVYPLKEGQKIQLPFFYFWDGQQNHGTIIKDDVVEAGSGANVEMLITRVGKKDFDAIFSGEVWSTKEGKFPIKNGILFKAKLPEIK